MYSSEKGLGTTLYNRLHNIAAQEGMETMSALPAHRSESAQRFHGRLGGRIVEKPFGDPAKGGMTVKYWRQVVHKEPFTTISAFGTRRGGSRIKQMFMR